MGLGLFLAYPSKIKRLADRDAVFTECRVFIYSEQDLAERSGVTP